MDNRKIASELNDLLTRNYDAERGYKEAAENVDDPTLKQFFIDQAHNRNEFGHRLKNEIRTLGQEPDKGTSLEGDVHRMWMNLKDTFTSGPEAMIEECIRGEKTAIQEYREFCTKDYIPTSVKTMFTNQMTSIENAKNKLQNLNAVMS